MGAHWPKGSGLRRALLTGGGTFAAGFGALNAFWQLGDWRRDVPGLWDYRSATIGDGVLLPLAAGVLVAAGSRVPTAPRERIAITSAGILGATAGALLQIAWLRDPSPQLNWTLPAPHTFNAPGLYHAAFLTVASGLFSAWTMRVLWRVRRHRSQDPARIEAMLRSPVAALLIGCLAGFVGLVVLDSYPTRDAAASVSSLLWSVAGTLLAGAVVAWSFGRSAVRAAWRTIGWGCLLAISICVFAWRSGELPAEIALPELLVVMAVGIALGVDLWKRVGDLWWIGTAVACLLLIGGLSRSISLASSGLIPALLVAILTVTAVGLTIRKLSPFEAEANQLVVAIAYPVLFLVAAAWLREGANDATAAGTVVSAVLLSLPAIYPIGKERYDALIRDEKRHNPGRPLEESYWVTWTLITCLFFAIMVALFRSIGAAAQPLGIDSPLARGAPYVPPLLIGAFLAVALSLAAAARSRPSSGFSSPPTWTKHSEEPVLPVRTGTVLWVMAAAGTWALTPWVATLLTAEPTTTLGPTRYSGALPKAWAPAVFEGWAAVMAIWFCYVAVDTIRTSVARIEFYELDRRGWIAALTCGAAVGSTVGWLWAVGVWARGNWASVTSIAEVVAIVYFGGTAAISICAWALARSSPGAMTEPGYLSLHHPAANVFNNLITHGFSLALSVFAVFLADRVASHVLVGGEVAWLKVVITLVPAYGAFLPAFGQLPGTIEEHVERERERGLESTTLFARAGCDPEGRNELNNERVERIGCHLNRMHRWAVRLSPHGIVSELVKFAKRRYRGDGQHKP
jgi:hypothetical protein